MNIYQKCTIWAKTVIWSVVCVFGITSFCYGVGVSPATCNPFVKRRILSTLLNETYICYADSDYAKQLLKFNATDCFRLPSGKYLVSRMVSKDDTRLIAAIIHKDTEAIMQILEEESRRGKNNKYSSIKELILKFCPPTENNQLSVNLYINHTVAKAFEWLVMTREGIIFRDEIPKEIKNFLKKIEPVINANKHNYFTNEFWDTRTRKKKIKTAINDGMVFYQASGFTKNEKYSSKEVLFKNPKTFREKCLTDIINKPHYHPKYNTAVTYVSRISQNFIDTIASKLPEAEKHEFLNIMEEVPGFFMYDAVMNNFLKIYQEQYIRVIELAEEAGYKNVGRKIEEFAKIELCSVAVIQQSMGFPSVGSSYFQNVWRGFNEEFDKLSKFFRIITPKSDDYNNLELIDFSYTLLSKFFAVRLLDPDPELFPTGLFQDKEFMKNFTLQVSPIAFGLTSQYMNLLDVEEQKKTKITMGGMYSLQTKEKIIEHFIKSSYFEKFLNFNTTLWAKRKIKSFLGYSKYVETKHSYSKILNIYSPKVQNELWIRIACAAEELEKAEINPRVLLYDFLHFGFPESNRNFTSEEFSELIDMAKNMAISMKKNNIKITMFEKEGGPNCYTHFTIFGCNFLKVDPAVTIKIFKLCLTMINHGIDYANSMYSISYFLKEIYQFEEVDESYAIRFFDLGNNLVKNGIDPSVFFRFIYMQYKGKDVEDRFYICEANSDYHSAVYLIETILDILTFLDDRALSRDFLCTIKRLDLKRGDLLAWSSIILWMITCFSTRDNKQEFLARYCKKLKSADSVKIHLIVFRDALKKRYKEHQGEEEEDFFKDMDTFIELCEVLSPKEIKTLFTKNVITLFAKRGISAKSISSLFRLRNISLMSGGDVYCTFWRASEFLLQNVKLKLLFLPGDIVNAPLKRKEVSPTQIMELDSIEELLISKGLFLKKGTKPQKIDRKLILILSNGDELVLKLCRKNESRERIDLAVEAHRLEYFNENKKYFEIESVPPKVISINGKYLFHFKKMPLELTGISSCGIAYVIKKNKRILLNDTRLAPRVLYQKAMIGIKDLAKFTRCGLIHTALIPMFHNREEDRVYQWYWRYFTRCGDYLLGGGAGRFDRWLLNCKYPNWMFYGVNDMEHMEYNPEIDSIHLRNEIGNHLLSWSLVVGSYYRNRSGFLGMERKFKTLLKDGFNSYYKEFTGRESPLDSLINWEDLTLEMITYMKKDRWKEDGTNPDLGPFNGPFPMQKLIRAIYLTSTLSVLELSRNQNVRSEEKRIKFAENETKTTKVLLVDTIYSKLNEEKMYTIKYDEYRLQQTQIDVIKKYAESLNKRFANEKSLCKINLSPCSSNNGSKESLIAIYCRDKNKKLIGEGHVDINIAEGKIEEYLLRITGMLNMAFIAANIPKDLTLEELKTKYGYMVGFMKNQYKEIIGNELSLSEISSEMLTEIHHIILTLFPSHKMPISKIESYNRQAIKFLSAL
ncbi:MAG: hypothetical protein ISS33_06740 [Candidatus Omnitrophica bacterium]|nr:hypothetical protein [Candidatus Omnitrophota bacterium]